MVETRVTDSETTKQAVQAFHNLSGEDVAKLKELNMKIQNHKGRWGTRRGGEKTASGATQERWTQNDPLIDELILGFMDEKGLLISYIWDEWNDSLEELFRSEAPAKYEDIDLETALRLVSAAARKERFASGTLPQAFESGDFSSLVNRLTKLAERKPQFD